MTQLRDALIKSGYGTKTTDWHNLQVSEPVDRQASHGIGGDTPSPAYNGALRDATLDALLAERESLVVQKEDNLKRLHRARTQLEYAKQVAHTRGDYMNPRDFVELENGVRGAGYIDQTLARRLKDLRVEINARRGAESDEVDDADPVALLKQACHMIGRAIDIMAKQK